MAIDLTDAYAGQLDPGDPIGYPYGEARNVTVVGDGTGFPLERQWINDLLGFEQSLLDFAGLVPSGTPDKVGASQYFQALQILVADAIEDTLENPVTFEAAVIFEAGVTFQESTTFTETATFGDSAVFNSTLTVNGVATLKGSNVIGDNALDTHTVTGVLNCVTALQCNGPTTLLGSLSVALAASFTENVTLGVSAELLANASATFQNVVTLNGGTNLNSTMTLVNAGHIRERIITGADADSTYGILDADIIFVASLSAPRAYTLSTTGAAQGDKITVQNNDSADVLTVNGLALAGLTGAAGTPRIGTWIYRTATGWTLHHVTRN